jgi:flagellar motor switch protein FliN/FliY
MKPATTPAPPSALETYVKTLFDGCAAAISTLLSRSVAIEPEGPTGPAEGLADALPCPWLVADARFTRGLAGAHQLVFTQDDVVVIARLLLGDDSQEEGVYSSDHEDALREMLNQSLSSASSALKVLMNRPTVLSLGDLRQVEDPSTWAAHGTVTLARILVDGVPRGRVALTIPPTVQNDVTAMQAESAEAGSAGPAPAGLELILDITMPITVELGRTRMLIRDILALGPGSVVELEKLAGEPVDLLVNDRAIAKGEVVVIDENFGVRLTQISQPTDRIRSMS